MRAQLLGFLACIILAGPVHAQQKADRTIPFEGPEIFAHILHTHEIKPFISIDGAVADPMQSVIVIMGNPSIMPKIREATAGLRQFLDQGGNVLVATDYPLTEGRWFRINGFRYTQAEKRAYHGVTECPWLNYAEASDPGIRYAEDHPIFGFLNRGIASNCPSRVDIIDKERLGPLLSFSEPHGAKGKFPVGVRLTYVAGSPKETPPRGRALVIAGHGMFMNGMLLQGDNDNFAFTGNAVRWLHEGADGKTSRQALFYYDGRIITDFNMNLTPTPPMPIPTKQMINRLLRGLEEERAFHEKIVRPLMGPNPAGVVALLVGLMTLAALGYGAKKLADGRCRFEAVAPSMVGVPQPAGPTASIEERHQALLRKGDLGAEARHLLLEWFHTELDVTPERWLAGVQAKFEAGGLLLARWRLQRQADFALSLARSAELPRVSRHQFFALVESLKELSRALQAGRLALLVEGKNVRQS